MNSVGHLWFSWSICCSHVVNVNSSNEMPSLGFQSLGGTTLTIPWSLPYLHPMLQKRNEGREGCRMLQKRKEGREGWRTAGGGTVCRAWDQRIPPLWGALRARSAAGARIGDALKASPFVLPAAFSKLEYATMRGLPNSSRTTLLPSIHRPHTCVTHQTLSTLPPPTATVALLHKRSPPPPPSLHNPPPPPPKQAGAGGWDGRWGVEASDM
jgi:hypothetical protein